MARFRAVDLVVDTKPDDTIDEKVKAEREAGSDLLTSDAPRE